MSAGQSGPPGREQSRRFKARHPAVTVRDQVEPVDEEIRVNGCTVRRSRTGAYEQRAHRTIASPVGHGGPHPAGTYAASA
ncbi:hypothetical protein ACF05L_13400 [Streptomyces bobili]|uniref:hypothetical protein n=1 Tax=Streptomyces bobili TaxID=67280 RepID=UPI0036FFE298